MSKFPYIAGPATLLICGATMFAATTEETPKNAVAPPAPPAAVAPAEPKVQTEVEAGGKAKPDDQPAASPPPTAEGRVEATVKVTAPKAPLVQPMNAPALAPAPTPAPVAKPPKAAKAPVGSRWLGMKLETVTGIRVSDVAKDSVAARYGLRAGDLLVSVDGHALHRIEDLSEAIRSSQRPVLVFTVLRDGLTFRMLVDRPQQAGVQAPAVRPRPAAAPEAAEAAIHVGAKSYSNEWGGVVLVRSSAKGTNVDFSAVYRDATGATRSMQISGDIADVLIRLEELPESLRQVVLAWLK
jgi:membrane-associated protease RseP (regulator of RpoE activity)